VKIFGWTIMRTREFDREVNTVRLSVAEQWQIAYAGLQDELRMTKSALLVDLMAEKAKVQKLEKEPAFTDKVNWELAQIVNGVHPAAMLPMRVSYKFTAETMHDAAVDTNVLRVVMKPEMMAVQYAFNDPSDADPTRLALIADKTADQALVMLRKNLYGQLIRATEGLRS